MGIAPSWDQAEKLFQKTLFRDDETGEVPPSSKAIRWPAQSHYHNLNYTLTSCKWWGGDLVLVPCYPPSGDVGYMYNLQFPFGCCAQYNTLVWDAAPAARLKGSVFGAAHSVMSVASPPESIDWMTSLKAPSRLQNLMNVGRTSMLWDKYPQVGTLEIYARFGPNITLKSSCANRTHNGWTEHMDVPNTSWTHGSTAHPYRSTVMVQRIPHAGHLTPVARFTCTLFVHPDWNHSDWGFQVNTWCWSNPLWCLHAATRSLGTDVLQAQNAEFHSVWACLFWLKCLYGVFFILCSGF